ncbi:hypothetical protein Tco_0366654 [Tanacetum coccineum]
MWLRRGDDGGGVAGLRGTPAGGEGKWRVRSGGDGGIWQRREWLVRSYGDSSGGSQMAAGGGMATRGACWYGESGRCRSGGSIFVYWPEIFRWPNDRCGGKWPAAGLWWWLPIWGIGDGVGDQLEAATYLTYVVEFATTVRSLTE